MIIACYQSDNTAITEIIITIFKTAGMFIHIHGSHDCIEHFASTAFMPYIFVYVDIWDCESRLMALNLSSVAALIMNKYIVLVLSLL